MIDECLSVERRSLHVASDSSPGPIDTSNTV
jgi:hypothetical protein